MNPKQTDTIIRISVLIIFIMFGLGVIALGTHRFSNRPADPNILTCREMTIEQAEVTFNIQILWPTIREWQRRLGCKKIDGKLGPAWYDSETQECWEKKLGNQFAKEYFK